MTTESAPDVRRLGPIGSVVRQLHRFDNRLGILPPPIPLLLVRICLALPYWKSGILKWEVFPVSVNSTAVYLFTEEFKIHVLGRALDFPMPSVVAHIAALGEVCLPVLLIVGLGTRLAALGLAIMTAVIQLTVPDAWQIHLTWFALALCLIAFGGGRLTLDSAFSSWLTRRAGKA